MTVIMKFFYLVLPFVIIWIYKSWFILSGTLSSGDWPYLFLENIKEFSFFPDPHYLWLGPYYQWTSKIFVEYLHIPWELTERVFWFWPVFILLIGSYYFFRSWVGVLIFASNTYILMLIGGGQMGVVVAYAIVPFVLARFISSSKNFLNSAINIRNSLISGLIIGLEVMFDPRIAYITFIALVLYWITDYIENKKIAIKSTLVNSLIILGTIGIINSFWIVPLMQGKTSIQVEKFESVSGFKFLSFADFSHVFSLLHPNWPENIFGKVYFLYPEFILLPIIAYTSLLFVKRDDKKILFFAILGIVGAFLAKGTNPPLGEINQWMFQHVSGMSMFRDSTKFYLLIVLSYSMLIPYTVSHVQNVLREKLKIKTSIPFLLIFFIPFYGILIRPALLGQLGGTFKPHMVPQEYVQFKNFLSNSSDQFSVLWIPDWQRFGFASVSHPAISGSEFFSTSNPLMIAKEIRRDKNQSLENRLRGMKIKYIVIPFDSESELFLVDRKYSNTLRDRVITELDHALWLKKAPSFGQNIVFEIQ